MAKHDTKNVKADIKEQDPDFTKEEIKELKRRIKDHKNMVRYVICSEIIPEGRWRLFLNVSDDTWCQDLDGATLFKREHVARAVLENYSEGSPDNYFIAKLTTKGQKRKILKYFR
jgi:hypothetical protein